MKSSRRIVIELLLKMDANGSYSNILLDSTFNREKLPQREKAFAASLFYGVLERRMTLDYIIRQYSSTEFDKLTPEAVEALRIGLYQILYMDSVPESAAVNETVSACEKKTKGFVNAVLRAFLRAERKIDLSPLDEFGKISIEYSCPKWLVKKWVAQLGKERAVEFLKSTFGRPPLYIKVNTLKYSVEDVIKQLESEKIIVARNAILPDCLELKRAGAIEGTKAYAKGMFHVQDISSQLCCKLIAPKFNETVLDMCAAPGGKSFTMAEYMNNRGTLLSFDLYEAKVFMIESGAERLGLSVIKPSLNDATVYNEKIPQADRVLCDVVCSGLGVIRRKPEIKYKPMKSLEAIPETQKKILETASKYVKVGGTLVYSTCTVNADENENIVGEFLNSHPEFTPIVVPLEISGLPEEYMRTFLPAVTGGDGFFAATLRRVR